MEQNGKDLSLMEALVLFNKTLYSEIFKDGKVTIPEILDGIKKFSYHGTIDNNNTVHNYTLDVDYSQTSYSDTHNTITKFDVFVKENDYSLTVTANNIAKNRDHLIELIKKEVAIHGWQCDLNHIDISHVTDISYLFCDSEFNGDISSWNTSNVTNMYATFSRSSFNGNISTWDTSSVLNMDYMLCDCPFNGDISNWNTSKVTTMMRLFSECKFNGDISNWDTSNVTNMSGMFYDCPFNGDISKWDVSNVENMTSMFVKAQFTGDLSNWTPFSLDNIKDIFKDSHNSVLDDLDDIISLLNRLSPNIKKESIKIEQPYWSIIEDNHERQEAIKSYWLKDALEKNLSLHYQTKKKLKI